jgi:hypothetical protein
MSQVSTASAESQHTKPLTHEQRRLLLMASLRAFVFRLQHGAAVRREEIVRVAELADPETRA